MKLMDKPQVHKTIYFVRHGQSDDNIAPVFQSPDSPLSPRGREQADLIAKRISKLSFELLVASPYRRAKETAEAIAQATDKEIEFSELFVERIKPSAINGKPYTDKEANDVWREWRKGLYTPGIKVSDGENFDDLVARADKALEFLENKSEQSIVVVTHGYFLRTIIARVLLGKLLTPEAFRKLQNASSVENTGLTVLTYQGDFEEEPAWHLWIFNDHAHLAD
jgi:broad specificity phosphatase PhoE